MLTAVRLAFCLFFLIRVQWTLWLLYGMG